MISVFLNSMCLSTTLLMHPWESHSCHFHIWIFFITQSKYMDCLSTSSFNEISMQRSQFLNPEAVNRNQWLRVLSSQPSGSPWITFILIYVNHNYSAIADKPLWDSPRIPQGNCRRLYQRCLSEYQWVWITSHTHTPLLCYRTWNEFISRHSG